MITINRTLSLVGERWLRIFPKERTMTTNNEINLRGYDHVKSITYNNSNS